MTRDDALEDVFDHRHDEGELSPTTRAVSREAACCRRCRLWTPAPIADRPGRRVCDCWLVETRPSQTCDHYEPMKQRGSVLG